jgi:hypothetical protein
MPKRSDKKRRYGRQSPRSNTPPAHLPYPLCDCCGLRPYAWRYDTDAFDQMTPRGVLHVDAAWRLCGECNECVAINDRATLLDRAVAATQKTATNAGITFDPAAVRAHVQTAHDQYFARLPVTPTADAPDFERIAACVLAGGRIHIAEPSFTAA